MSYPDRVVTTALESGCEDSSKTENCIVHKDLDWRVPWAQALVLVFLYSFPAFVCLRGMGIADPDVWWHLRTGEWIMQHHAVPRVDTFSSFTAGKPWSAYSWLFDLLIVQLFQRFGLIGIMAYTTGMGLAITMALHRLIRSLQTDFSYAVLITVLACFCLLPLWTPRPWLFTILFFTLELGLLLHARRSDHCLPLLWLPVIFALWANTHIQFIDGLVVLVIALVESALAGRWITAQTRLRFGTLGLISCACVLATWVNPYGWNIYRVAYDLATQTGVLNKVSELQALPFRSYSDWGVLLITLCAVGTLVRIRQGVFLGTLLAFAIYVSFHSQRDLWVVVITGSAILSLSVAGREMNGFRIKRTWMPIIAAVAVLIVVSESLVLKINNDKLHEKLSESMPVRAAEFVKERGLQGPLFNDYGWGGYLIWSLRIPVSIDGRAALQGDQHIDDSVATWGGQTRWVSDPELANAKLVIGPVNSPLTQILRLDPRYQLQFEDKIATVFVSRNGTTGQHSVFSGKVATAQSGLAAK